MGFWQFADAHPIAAGVYIAFMVIGVVALANSVLQIVALRRRG